MEMISAKEKGRTRKRKLLNLPEYTLAEEILNAVTHGIGALLALAAVILLILYVPENPVKQISSLVYAGSMVLLYLVSCLYHALPVGRPKKVFQVLDHCTVYVLIAGTYTPVSLVSIGGTEGIFLTSFVWGVALCAILLNVADMHRFRVLSMIFYIALGWCALFFLRPLVSGLDPRSLFFLIFGGVLYTMGAVIYGLGRTHRYMHALWHIFCLLGSLFQFFVVWKICTV